MKPYCSYCFMPHDYNINHETISAIASRILNLKPKMVVLSGGEPTTIDILPNIIDIFKLHEIKVCLATNGINLMNLLPDFCGKIDTITLPLDNIPKCNSHRNKLCVESVMGVLSYIKEYSLLGYKKPNVIINTLLNKNNINDIDRLRDFLSLYPIDVWKIFEYIHIVGNNSHLEPYRLSFEQINKLKLQSNQFYISYEDIENKDSRYFMVNPDGSIVIPTRKYGNVFEDILIGSLFDAEVNFVDIWKDKICLNRYYNSNKVLKV